MRRKEENQERYQLSKRPTNKEREMSTAKKDKERNQERYQGT